MGFMFMRWEIVVLRSMKANLPPASRPRAITILVTRKSTSDRSAPPAIVAIFRC